MLLAIAPLALLGIVAVVAGGVYVLTMPSNTTKAPTGESTTCPTTEADAKALGEKIKPELDAWATENPIPANVDDVDGTRAWFKAFVAKAFALIGPCATSERTAFAREFRRGFVASWVFVLAAAGKIPEEPNDVVAWLTAHPEWDPLDGMPWEQGEIPPAQGEQVVQPTRAGTMGGILADVLAE